MFNSRIGLLSVLTSTKLIGDQISLITLLLPVILLVNCDFLPKSEGNINEVIIAVSPEDKVLVKPILDDLFYEVIHTPQSEHVFTCRWINPWDLDDYKTRTNLMVVSLKHPNDSTGDRLFERFTESSIDDHHTIAKTDMYAKGQLFLGLSGVDAIDFEIQTKKNRDWILSQLKSNFDVNLSDYVFSKKKNPKLSKLIEEQFGFHIDLQRDFQMIKDDSGNKFLWIGRGVPYRWLIFHQFKGDFSTPEKSWKIVEEAFRNTIQDIQLSTELRTHETIVITESNVRMIRGIYIHDESQSGGPFFTIFIPNEKNDDMILISGFVNNPGHPKLKLVKQLEVIAKTFEFR